jgi:hypothetical protein
MSKTGEWGDKMIIILPGDGEHRHKKSCEHYRKSDGHCCLYNRKCGGSSHCEDYTKIDIPDDPIPPAPKKKPKKENQPKPQKPEDLLRRVGTRLKHKIFGEVTVQSSTNETITVITSSGKIHTLNIEACIKCNIIKILDF